MKLRFLLLGLLTAGLTFAVACGDLEEDCSEGEINDDNATCMCTDDTGATCDPDEDEECSCAFVGGDATNNDTNNATNNDTNNATNNATNNDTNNDVNNVATNTYRFVLVEDETVNTSGRSPGADLDAIEVVKNGGGSFYATAVEDITFGPDDGNEALTQENILGAPDDNCAGSDATGVALGGVGGYVIVSFGTDAQDVTIENGDSIRVHEIGSTSCPGQFDDDPYSVSVSVSTSLGDFIEIATDVNGDGAVSVSGLP
jgi:hypothetical protein